MMPSRSGAASGSWWRAAAVELFERDGKSVRLTLPGQPILTHARRAVTAADDLLAHPSPWHARRALESARGSDADYVQVRALFNLFDAGQKKRLFSNIAEAMAGIPEDIAERQLAHFGKVHADYEAGIRAARKTGDDVSDSFHQQAAE